MTISITPSNLLSVASLNIELTDKQKSQIRDIQQSSYLNLTQHPATPEQRSNGVIDLLSKDTVELKHCLTFHALPTREVMECRAEALVNLCESTPLNSVMIGGAPYFMSVLEQVLRDRGISVFYAFSERVSEEKEVNGEVIKVNKFKHLGFVPGREVDGKPTITEFYSMLEWVKTKL